MALYPGAKQRRISKWNQVKITRYRRMNLHVAVWGQDSIHDLFANSNSACSHFYVNKAGGVEQLIDTKYRSAADRDGNDSTISVETEGGLSNVNGEEWTAAQLVALAQLWAWARDTHGITNQIAINTNTNANSAGLSWHRLGIKGNFSGRPGLASKSYGGILYSGSVGKECPGDAKINQIPEIFAMADGKSWKDVDGGGKIEPVGSVKPKPKPKPKGTPKVQLNTTPPNGGTTFPTDYEDLVIDSDFGGISIGALQILLHALKRLHNERWDGDFGKLTTLDFQEQLQDMGYYKVTPFAAKGVRKGVRLKVDGDDGYWFWVEVQRMLKDRGHYPRAIDGDPKGWTARGLQLWLNTSNGR